MIITFVVHRDASWEIYHSLYQTIQLLIEKEEAQMFFVGDCGNFDRMAYKALRELKKIYKNIDYQVVLAYMPCGENSDKGKENTLFPAELATVPARFAIDRRNRWLIEHSDAVIAYVKRSYGGAVNFKKRAISKGKRIIEL